MAELIVNTNSYVTVEEADSYIVANYPSDSPEYMAWFSETLPSNDKNVRLISSANALNNLPYRGKKAVGGQRLAFPRSLSTMFPGVIYPLFVSQFSDSSLVDTFGTGNGLALAKEAQIVNAVSGIALDRSLITAVTERTVAGIRASKRGNVSESYDSRTEYSDDLMIGIYNSPKVRSILRPWITESISSI